MREVRKGNCMSVSSQLIALFQEPGMRVDIVVLEKLEILELCIYKRTRVPLSMPTQGPELKGNLSHDLYSRKPLIQSSATRIFTI